ncbi:MAG: shikimate dehydrogenase [Gammaproteobacteria bacterium]|nr:shikimate dehydrogenase [Gammaproteobacteria bacterium]
MSVRYGVIGNPIEHSKSPLIHAAFAAQSGDEIDYRRILGTAEGFEREVADFFRQGGGGLNVTVPFKERAWRLADRLGASAELAQAVNTLIPAADGGLRGENTDGIGLVRDLVVNHGCHLNGSRILLLGAGGASKGVAPALLEQGPLSLTIANRTAAKAEDLAARLASLGLVRGCGLDALGDERFDLIINGTSAGLSDQLPALPPKLLEPGGWSYDLMYASEATAFVRWGRAQGADQSLDGLGMLVEQAAESFFLWRGIRPETAPVIAMLSGSR